MNDKQSQENADVNATDPAVAPQSPPDDKDAKPSSDPAHSGATDDDDAGDASAAAPEDLPAEDPIAVLEQELAKSKAKWLRSVADFENYRKRSARELDEIRRRSRQSAVIDLLPVIDNISRATMHIDEQTDAASMAQGIAMVMQQFTTTLKKMNIELIEAVGKAFDPTVHDSIQYEYSEKYDAGFVMTEIQAGYRMGDDLLRPATVVVSRGRAPEEDPAAPDKSSETEGAD